MKTIINQPTEILSSSAKDEPTFMSYFDLIKIVINQPSQEGYNIEQIRQRLIIWNIVDSAKDMMTTEMEIKDFNVLKDAVNKFKWVQVHKDIVKFVDYINSL